MKIKINSRVIDLTQNIETLETNDTISETPIKIVIEWTREKIIRTIEVRYIDEETYEELWTRFIHSKTTKKENMYLRAVTRAIDLRKVELFLKQ